MGRPPWYCEECRRQGEPSQADPGVCTSCMTSSRLRRASAIRSTAPTRTLEADQPWRKHAACIGATDLFFDSDPAPALAICGRCPVVTECLDWALSDPELLGVAGGTTRSQRKRRRRAIGT